MNQISLEQFDAVIFDVEGTLVDTIPAHHQARYQAFDQCGYQHITPEQHAAGSTYGSTAADIIGNILYRAGAIDKRGPFNEHPDIQAVLAAKELHFSKLAAQGFDEMPGATRFFKDIAPQFYGKIALVTASPWVFIEGFVMKHGLDEVLSPERTITEDTIRALGLRSKPAPDGYELAAQRMDAKNMLVFEDTVSGVAAAKAAGATVVALCFEPQNTELFRKGNLEYAPDYLVEDYMQARELLGLDRVA